YMGIFGVEMAPLLALWRISTDSVDNSVHKPGQPHSSCPLSVHWLISAQHGVSMKYHIYHVLISIN
ncbi:MAG: hypothetical protein L0H54_08280, partial [Alcaligenaceae bacterium]|nr:hypothetical protein [Alcaligenaceae bacterium]